MNDSENQNEPISQNQDPSHHFLSSFSKAKDTNSDFQKESLTPTVQKPLEAMLRTYQIQPEVYEQILKENTKNNSLVSLII